MQNTVLPDILFQQPFLWALNFWTITTRLEVLDKEMSYVQV